MPSLAQYKQALMDSETPLTDMQARLKAMIYGESGVGKTVLALELAHAICPPGKVIRYVDAVEGWVSLKNHPGLLQNVKRMRYEGLSQIHLFAELFEQGDEWATSTGVLVLDEISVIAQLDLDNVVGAQVKAGNNKGRLDDDQPIWPDMNINTHRVRKMTLALGRLDLHQIFLSHIREDEDSNKGYKVTRPEFMPKISTTLRNPLHVIAHMTADEKTVNGTKKYVRQLQTHPTKTVVAKSRIGGLGVHCSPETLIEQTVKWIGGEVEEVETQSVIDDTTAAILSDDPAIEVQV